VKRRLFAETASREVDGTPREGETAVRPLQAAGAATRALRLNGFPDAARDRMSERSRRLNLIRFARRKPAIPPCTRAELRLLGTAPDEVVAARIDRTATAVRVKRSLLGISNLCDHRKKARTKPQPCS